jgi:methyl-accepting chemotaxis protein
LAENVSDNTKENSVKINSAAESMNAVVDSTDNCKEIIQSLDKKSNEILNIISLITDISSQTKILSLNASIEAARAGEYGRGFEVVADEIHNLSNQTRDAVENIAHILEGVVNDTGNAVIAMENNTHLTKMGLESINDARKASEYIENSNLKMKEQIEGLYEIAKNINSDNKDIQENVLKMKKAMDGNLENIKYVTIITEESSTSAETLVGMVDTIKNMSDKLNHVVKE